MPVHLTDGSLDWALKHIEAHGDTDIFPVPFEFKAIRHCWEAGSGFGEIRAKGIKQLLREADIAQRPIRPYRRCLSPKTKLGFRISTQLDPLDILLFTALTYELAPEIEAARIPIATRVVHSYRFDPSATGQFFSPDWGYGSFLTAANERASAAEVSWVVTADIADFYPRIYSHPLENALKAASGKAAHVRAITDFLGQLNQNVSYGIPVGPSASRLLAELTLTDVDRLLLSEGIQFVRFVDDYRIFCRSERDAYQALGLLANALFDLHGLTLQQHKTKIYEALDFLVQSAPDEEDLERQSLTAQFENILRGLGIDSWYEPISYGDLSDQNKALVDALNLRAILDEQLALGEELNTGTIRFLLGRFAQLGDTSISGRLFDNAGYLYPILRSLVGYTVMVRWDNAEDKLAAGRSLAELLDHSVLGHLSFNRSWILSAFARDRGFGGTARLIGWMNSLHDEFDRRELILAMGEHRVSEWLRANKRFFMQNTPWCRRAFLKASTAMPGDESAHWFKALRPQMDLLEQAVAIWAEASR